MTGTYKSLLIPNCRQGSPRTRPVCCGAASGVSIPADEALGDSQTLDDLHFASCVFLVRLSVIWRLSGSACRPFSNKVILYCEGVGARGVLRFGIFLYFIYLKRETWRPIVPIWLFWHDQARAGNCTWRASRCGVKGPLRTSKKTDRVSFFCTFWTADWK